MYFFHQVSRPKQVRLSRSWSPAPHVHTGYGSVHRQDDGAPCRPVQIGAVADLNAWSFDDSSDGHDENNKMPSPLFKGKGTKVFRLFRPSGPSGVPAATIVPLMAHPLTGWMATKSYHPARACQAGVPITLTLSFRSAARNDSVRVLSAGLSGARSQLLAVPRPRL